MNGTSDTTNRSLWKPDEAVEMYCKDIGMTYRAEGGRDVKALLRIIGDLVSAGSCEGLSQEAAKAYHRRLRRLIAGGCEGLSQEAAKAYRRTLRRLRARGCEE
jgi:hypothetical protein